MNNKQKSDNTNTALLPSNRNFGLFFTAVFVLGSVYAYRVLSTNLAFIFIAIAALFAGGTFIVPKLLTPLNKAWYVLGTLLGRIVNPIVMGIIFYILITPVAVLMRLFGHDALKLKKQNVKSYWMERNPSGPQPDSFKNQF